MASLPFLRIFDISKDDIAIEDEEDKIAVLKISKSGYEQILDEEAMLLKGLKHPPKQT